MAKKVISREYRVYLALWRKAYQERDKGLPPITVYASTYAMAISMRQGMYRAIKPFRDGTEFDHELSTASEVLVPSIAKEPNTSGQYELILKRRDTLSELELQLANLGISDDDLKLTEERMAEVALSEFMETPTSEEAPINPFYKR